MRSETWAGHRAVVGIFLKKEVMYNNRQCHASNIHVIGPYHEHDPIRSIISKKRTGRKEGGPRRKIGRV